MQNENIRKRNPNTHCIYIHNVSIYPEGTKNKLIICRKAWRRNSVRGQAEEGKDT